MRSPKASPTTAIVPRLPVVTFELRGSRHRREARCKRLASCSTGALARLLERGVASDPVERRATAVRRVRAHPMLRCRPGLGSDDFAGDVASYASTLCSPDLASLEACRESLPVPSPWLHRRLRGDEAASPWPVVARLAFPRTGSLSCAGPLRLRAKSLSRVPPVSDSSIAGRSGCGGSRCLSSLTFVFELALEN